MTIIPHIAFVGFSGSGKTTLITQVILQLKLKGYRIGILKHDAHDFQMDVEGKDTYKYGEAGADIVAISSGTKLNILEKLQQSLALEEILLHFHGVDLIIIEGYKQANVPKILVARTLDQLALFEQLSQVTAIASSYPADSNEIARLLKQSSYITLLDLNEISAVTDFIENWLLVQQHK